LSGSAVDVRLGLRSSLTSDCDNYLSVEVSPVSNSDISNEELIFVLSSLVAYSISTTVLIHTVQSLCTTSHTLFYPFTSLIYNYTNLQIGTILCKTVLCGASKFCFFAIHLVV